jgi:energy-converting hydrogenase Eha subunit B
MDGLMPAAMVQLANRLTADDGLCSNVGSLSTLSTAFIETWEYRTDILNTYHE